MGGAGPTLDQLPDLEAVITQPESVFEGFLGCLRFFLGVLFFEACLVPALPRRERVVGRCEGFLFANGDDPLINRSFVGLL